MNIVLFHSTLGPRPAVRQAADRLRDSDGDGVPNRYDRRPHNPYRY